MPTNGIASSNSSKGFDWHAWLLALAVASSTAGFGFVISMTRSVAVLQEQRIQEKEWKDDMKQDINEIKLDIREIRSSKSHT